MVIQFGGTTTIPFLQEGDVIELCQVSDIRAGGLPKDMKLLNQLANKHGENLEEKSLTICSGTDYINVNYQHIICPDTATAKVSDSITVTRILTWGVSPVVLGGGGAWEATIKRDIRVVVIMSRECVQEEGGRGGWETFTRPLIQ